MATCGICHGKGTIIITDEKGLKKTSTCWRCAGSGNV